MNARIFYITAISLLFFNIPSVASEKDSYIGIQHSMITYSESGLPDFSPTAIVGRYGYFFDNNIGFEARLGTGLEDSSNTINDDENTLKIDNLYGLYLVGDFPVSESFSIYGFAGYSRVVFTMNKLPYPSTTSENTLSYGAGITVDISNKTSFTAEYANYYNRDNITIDATSIGFNFMF